MLKADLKVLGGKQHGKLIPLLTPKFLIGREQDCQLRPSSELVSRHHCVFSVDDFSVRLRDLGSTNGTLVNGQKIRGQVVLNPGDRVRIGKLEFEIVVRPGVRQAQPVPAGGPGEGPPVPIETPTPPPTTAPLPVEADTGQLSSSETSFELPAAPNVLNDTSANAAAESGDTTVFYPGEAAAQQPPAQPQPPPADPMQAPPAGEAAHAPQAPSPPAGEAPPAPQAPPPPPGYPPQMPPQHDPMQYPGQMPQYPPGAYPQMPYPQYGYPYPQMPPQYFPQGMPYQQPHMMPPPQQPAPEPQADLEEDLDDLDSSGHVPAPPVRLPKPEETGASPEKPVVGSEGTVKREGGADAEKKPYEKAADLIKQMVQRRPGKDD